MAQAESYLGDHHWRVCVAGRILSAIVLDQPSPFPCQQSTLALAVHTHLISIPLRNFYFANRQIEADRTYNDGK
jgi:hypothetical protein